MIKKYYRPQSISEALDLISKPNTYPLGGGTILSHPDKDISVVDLQSLGLDEIHVYAKILRIGATVKLQSLIETDNFPSALQKAVKKEAPLNIRNMASLAGSMVSCDGRSPFSTVMLALNCKIIMAGENSKELYFGEFLISRPEVLKKRLITYVEIPKEIKLAFHMVSRSPSDKPIICVSIAQWTSGRIRMTVGGWGTTPILALDGKDTSGIEDAARNAAHDSDDEWASAEYRMDVSSTLARRCLEDIQNYQE
jgi:CO/xanthine dehydrogenase FAD-binding subunit